ncbi:MAG: excinuclease ABC subunit UvrA [Acidobacteria bacterium]|nr:MAG: excinuclease ABC subunit UvrA [Acidobacteriota bacterium]REK02502.1 MAG: excinuclease ABC subunit UvrA [Acidobacteriota bacterium]REK13696.1 MAG: excinuclease ABC subunit UvrA [Acidobacteriota bacterium]REK41690.1 MAG: excinuclease ABC subunit UvrA [Acidobacteriota bacterium]
MQAAKTKEDAIRVRGARVHNLKNVSVSIPNNKLTVVTGVSGSGKSSLAFDTIYAEGQRRYVESLSAYARQFLERIDKPLVDEITGIAPAIAIRQKNSTRNPRSTVATQTEIYDYLRLLFARIGRTYCYKCGEEVTKDSPESSADEVISKLPVGSRFLVLFPLSVFFNPNAKEQNRTAVLMTMLGHGFSRIYRDGDTIDLQKPEDYEDEVLDDVLVLVDRLKASDDVRQRLVDTLETCFRESHSAIIVNADSESKGGPEELRFSEAFVCRNDGTEFEEPEPRLFSFNSPFGACPTCQGFGNTTGIDYDLVIPDPEVSLKDDAIEPFSTPKHRWAYKELMEFAEIAGIPVDVPFGDLTDDQQRAILKGSDGWRGVKGFFKWKEKKKYKLHVRVFLAKYRGYTRCPDCDGGRLRVESSAVKIGGKSLPDAVAMSLADAKDFFDGLELSEEESKIGEKLLDEIRRRLGFMLDVGLEYLTLDRLASTLSGGEAQRIQLATNLGSLLVGTLYVLDEPSIGLHPRDNLRLIRILENLRDIGNTVVVVEHDEEMMRAADHVLDIGIYAGELGGNVVYEGDFLGLVQNPISLTAKYLRGESEIMIPPSRKEPGKKKIKLNGAREHNLKGIDVEFPLEMFVAVTGVSGSGKSTLIHDVLFTGLKKELGDYKGEVGKFRSIEGAGYLDDVILVDQSPIGRTPRSNPITYIKAFDPIREVFASTNLSQKKGYSASHFSFNVPGGRCEHCQGSGTVKIEMQFLADVELTCEDCRGTRYAPEILEVKYKGKNINDVLNLTVREAIRFFRGIRKLTNRLRTLEAVGLGYLRLGQSATTLSGGEAQRVKLAAHLSAKSASNTLFIFDEPTTGLHFDDISKLLTAFRALIDNGGSVLVIEHNLDVIKTADWVIDLGPEGGIGGGTVVAEGSPEAIAKVKESYTGQFLKKYVKAEN